MNIKKKLLILGAFPQICDIIQDAVDTGYHVIVTDNVLNSPGKKIATEHHMVSIVDVNKLIELCKNNNVDGVMNYCIHSGQMPYYKICTTLGLPCYGTENQFKTLTDKNLFKETCKNHNVDIVSSYKPDLDFLKNLSENEFPIVVKPSDGRASKGITICHSRNEIEDALNHASFHSANGEILVEKYMTGPEVAVKYFVVEGEIFLTSMSDIHTYYHEGARTYIWTQTFPSKSYQLYLKNADHKVRSMIEALGIMNGPLSFSGFVDNGMFRFIDPSFRLGGAQDWLIVEKTTGVNISRAMTIFAVTGSMGNPTDFKIIDGGFSKKASAMLYFLARPGVIGDIIGVKDAAADPTVISYHQCHQVGSSISQFGSSDHVVMRFLIVADDIHELKSAMYSIQDKIEVIDNTGENMLYPNFNPELLTS